MTSDKFEKLAITREALIGALFEDPGLFQRNIRMVSAISLP